MRRYRTKFPEVQTDGYALNSLVDERTVDEQAVEELFQELDRKNIFVDSLMLNAADQGLNIKAFENPLTDFMLQYGIPSYPR